MPISRRTILEVALVGSALSAALFVPLPAGWEATPGSMPLWDERSAVFFVEHVAAQEHPGLPIRLTIPAIHVDSPVEYVGLAADGSMDVPKSRDVVAWFELGQRPGEVGNAVIAGHYGIRNGKGSVFDDAHKLRPGDTILIEDDRGGVVSFVVRESRRFDVGADPSGVFGSDDGLSHLNLITCEGTWDEATNSYPARLVVFADKVDR